VNTRQQAEKMEDQFASLMAMMKMHERLQEEQEQKHREEKEAQEQRHGEEEEKQERRHQHLLEIVSF
jgi:hypothetical protein